MFRVGCWWGGTFWDSAPAEGIELDGASNCRCSKWKIGGELSILWY